MIFRSPLPRGERGALPIDYLTAKSNGCSVNAIQRHPMFAQKYISYLEYSTVMQSMSAANYGTNLQQFAVAVTVSSVGGPDTMHS